MKLQLALDMVDIEGAKAILKEVNGVIDIAEVGTPFVIKEGLRAVTEIKNAYPSLKVLADLKIMDAGEHEARLGFHAGADIVTVLGVADDITIRRVVKAARECRGQVMVDMISVADIEKRAVQIDNFGVDYICVHTAFDVQDSANDPLEEMKLLKHALQNAKPAIAGGIKKDTLKQIIPYKPEIVVVGGSITSRPDVRQAALEIKEIMKKGEIL
ncbi:3-hexulose-6-phosphate synthase [candidate division KSB1 bacterium]|nr:MAG: 3-hexulose-6-phosphate synthase [candidate division KSB1 bacterium]